jgi:hypothetical protein
MAELVYILAASHSGSTLLAMLLGAHRQTVTVGELKATSLGDADAYRCSCGQPIRECGFWSKISAAMAARGIRFDIADARTDVRADGSAYTRRLLRPLHRGAGLEWFRDAALALSPTWRTRLPELQKTNAALVQTICEVTGKRMVIDSSKTALRLKYLLRNPELNVKVVRLIRDGRAVALTYVNPMVFANTQNDRMRIERHEQLSLEDAVYRWRRSNEEADALLAGIDPAKYLTLRYEDYCLDPDRALERAFRFLELDPGQAVRDFRTLDSHVIGNAMRFDDSSEIVLDERWRTVLTRQQLMTFDQLAGRLNRQYGYN